MEPSAMASSSSRRPPSRSRSRRLASPSRTRAPHVWKFGGASLADATAVQAAAARIAAHDGPLVIVASALAGVTDLLLLGADQAMRGDAKGSAATAVALWQKHRRAAEALLPRGPVRRAALADIEASIGEYADICTAVGILGHLSPRTRDLLVARGERLSALLLAGAITRAGRRAEVVDAVEMVHTDGQFGGASPLVAESATAARARLAPVLKAKRVPVVPGYIGGGPDGSVVTLGRGGSDLTATLLGRAFDAPMVTLWKDVPGILTSDPKLVPDTRLIPQLHHQEAAEVAHYGAKVLHPRALIPISGTKVVLEVRSFLEPTRPGTIVAGAHVSTSYPVKAVAVLPKQAVVTVAGKGMVGVHGIAARTFAAVSPRSTRSGCRSPPSSRARPKARSGSRCPSRKRIAPWHRRRLGDARRGGHRGGRRRHGRHARHRRPRLHRARNQRHQRRRHRPGVIGAEHLVRGRRHRRRDGRAQGPQRLPVVEDRRRTGAVASADRRGAARLRPRRP